MNIRYS